ncbi:MAG: amidase family protein [Neomegalonema sp.]|nr:amidase family protein [Neomegalonema sp.]
MSSTVRDRLERILANIEGGGARHPAFVALDAAAARISADAADRRRTEGRLRGALDGLLIPVKDLFDVAGEVTQAGAAMRASAAPATADAAIVARLREAGAVILGRTHMSEFAFSGLGLNAGFPLLRNHLDPSRIPGGSSSGAAVAVAAGLADIAIGTDTGGSCRIPAALNGIVGMKTSHGRVPAAGCFPLAPSLDSIGPLGPSVAACADAFSVLAGAREWAGMAAAPHGLRLAILRGKFLDAAPEAVVTAYEAALARLAAAGVALQDLSLDAEWDAMLSAFPAPMVTIEAAAVHWDTMRNHPEQLDPRIAARIQLGMDASAVDYIRGGATRAQLIAKVNAKIARFDAVLSPTVAIAAPSIASLQQSDDAYFAANGLLLRNPTFGNLFDLCAISLPLPLNDQESVGLQIAQKNGDDERILAVAAGLEQLLRSS